MPMNYTEKRFLVTDPLGFRLASLSIHMKMECFWVMACEGVEALKSVFVDKGYEYVDVQELRCQYYIFPIPNGLKINIMFKSLRICLATNTS